MIITSCPSGASNYSTNVKPHCCLRSPTDDRRLRHQTPMFRDTSVNAFPMLTGSMDVPWRRTGIYTMRSRGYDYHPYLYVLDNWFDSSILSSIWRRLLLYTVNQIIIIKHAHVWSRRLHLSLHNPSLSVNMLPGPKASRGHLDHTGTYPL